MFLQHQVSDVPLIRREIPASIILDGVPQFHGRILSVSEDKCTAQVVWQMTKGAVVLEPDPKTNDVLYAIDGKAEIRMAGQATQIIEPGTMIECPHSRFEIWVADHFKKISFIYNPEGLTLKAEAL